MVAINQGVDESVALKLAEPLDAVGKLKITTFTSRFLTKSNTGTATLIAPNKILTAAHVIDSDQDGIVDIKDTSQYSFLLGDDLETGADHNLKIERVSLHPSWVASEENRIKTVDGETVFNARYDLAVLTLSEDFTDVEPIKISPNEPKLADNASLLRKRGTIVGYGKSGSPNAISNNKGQRRAARNTIDSVANGLIRFDYDDRPSLYDRDNDEGLNHPNLDGSQPDLIPIPSSSPEPLLLEGGFGEGDSGGPLLVDSILGDPVIVGVASKFIDTEAIGSTISGYGSVYVYSALNDPKTREFLNAQNVIDSDSKLAASPANVIEVEAVNTSLNNGSKIISDLALPKNNLAVLSQAEIESNAFISQNDELLTTTTDYQII